MKKICSVLLIFSLLMTLPVSVGALDEEYVSQNFQTEWVLFWEKLRSANDDDIIQYWLLVPNDEYDLKSILSNPLLTEDNIITVAEIAKASRRVPKGSKRLTIALETTMAEYRKIEKDKAINKAVGIFFVIPFISETFTHESVAESHMACNCYTCKNCVCVSCVKVGRVHDSKFTIFHLIEIFESLTGVYNKDCTGNGSFTADSKRTNEPSIFDALKILEKIAGM